MQLSKFEIVSYLSAVVLFFLAQVFFEAPFWLLYVTVGCAGVIVFFVEYKRKSKKFLLLAPESTKYLSPYEVNFDDSEVIVSVDGKRYGSVSWDDLIFIGIRVENQEYISVLYWILGGQSGGYMYPINAVEHDKGMDEFKNRLPGFHSKETYLSIGRAMVALDGGSVVWKRPTEADTN